MGSFEQHVRQAQTEWAEEDEELARETDGPLGVLEDYMQGRCVTSCLLVEDEETLQDGLLLLLWPDEFGHIVRKYRIKPERVMDVVIPLGDGSWKDDGFEFWAEDEVGEDYKQEEVRGGPFPYPSGDHRS